MSILVKFKQGVTDNEADNIHKELGGKVKTSNVIVLSLTKSGYFWQR